VGRFPLAPGEVYVPPYFFFSSRRRHTSSLRDWSSDVCSSDLRGPVLGRAERRMMAGMIRLGEPQDRRGRGALFEDVGAEAFGHQIGRASCRERWRSAEVGG